MQILDHLIIGAGPAGLQLGYYFEKKNRTYLILEKNDVPGSFFKKFPVHRMLISSNKVHTGYDQKEINLRWDWNSLLSDSDKLVFKNYSKEYFPAADTMVEYLKDFKEEHNLKVEYNFDVVRVSRNEHFEVLGSDGRSYMAKSIIMATGVTKPYLPEIPGIEYAKPYSDLNMDKSEFENKKVLILGKGNSAFETADYLVDTTALTHVCSPNSVKMAWSTHFVGHLRAVNNNFLDTYHLKSQNALLDADVRAIRKEGDKLIVSVAYKNESAEVEELEYDAIIACTGFRFDNAFFDDNCKPQLTIKNRYPDLTCEWESCNVDGLYFVGTITQSRDYKKATSGFIHGFRYNVKALAEILDKNYHGEEIGYDTVDLDENKLMTRILDQVNTSSAIWQQFGFLCDAICINEKHGNAHYYKGLSMDYVKEKMSKDYDAYILVTLEYGPELDQGDHESIKRISRFDFENAQLSKFLHPVIRCYSNNEQQGELHLLEDLFAEWKKDVHTQPLTEFLRKQLESMTTPAEF